MSPLKSDQISPLKSDQIFFTKLCILEKVLQDWDQICALFKYMKILFSHCKYGTTYSEYSAAIINIPKYPKDFQKSYLNKP